MIREIVALARARFVKSLIGEGSAMKVSRWLVVAVVAVASGCNGLNGRSTPETPVEAALQEGERKTSTDPAVNPDAAAMADFQKRVDAYADLHKRLAKGDAAQKQTSDAGRLNDAQNTLTARVQAARADAKHGEVFTDTIRPVFRRLLAPELKGQAGRDAKAVLKDDAPDAGTVPFKVNAKYPDGQPLPTVPANLLLTLPPLPAPLEYRIVGQHLLLLDTGADLVVDYILNAIST
jgi:hypothetical protein